MHWHINANEYRLLTFWTLQEVWERAVLMEDARRESKFDYIITVTECESLECLVEEMAK